MASEVVPVSKKPRAASAAALASTTGMNRLTMPDRLSGTGETTPMFIVPVSSLALMADMAFFSS